MTLDQPTGTAAPTQPGAEAVRAQTERLLAHTLFRYSQRSCNLLRYIVDRTLSHQNDELKERIIGISVFNRAPDYDTSNDSTVRVVANEVRKRLTEYYAQPEHASEVRIEIPVRTYVAEFRLAEPVPVAPPPTVPAEPVKAPRRFLRRYLWAFAAFVVVAVGIAAVVRLALPSAEIDRFWAPVVKDPAPALICVGSPFNPSDSADNSAAGSIATVPGAKSIPFYNAEQRVYVRMLDANAAEQLGSFLRGKGKDSQIRPTQGSQLADFRSAPLILYGMSLNESAAKLGVDLHFLFRKDSESGQGVRWIEDLGRPGARDWFVDLSAPSDKVGVDYALISRVRDKTSGRWWIGIAGLTGVGTLAASQIVVDSKTMDNICAGLPRDWDKRNLQIVLEIKVVQGEPGATRVLTTYTW
jgi:hypothetical protein